MHVDKAIVTVDRKTLYVSKVDYNVTAEAEGVGTQFGKMHNKGHVVYSGHDATKEPEPSSVNPADLDFDILEVVDNLPYESRRCGDAGH